MQPPNPNEPRPKHLRAIPTPKKGKLPPELADVPDNDMVMICFAAVELIERVMRKTVDPWDVINTCFIRLCETHRWIPTRGPLRTHFLVLVTNELHVLKKLPNAHEREEYLADAYTRETYHSDAPSAEDALLARAQRVYDIDASKRAKLIAMVRRRVANTIADALFDHWASATEELTMHEIAAKLGVTVDQLYAAKKMIEYHARACREELEGK
jgi:hypothetical protein